MRNVDVASLRIVLVAFLAYKMTMGHMENENINEECLYSIWNQK